MLDNLASVFERKKVIPFKWTAEHKELLKDHYSESYNAIRILIGGNNDECWPSDDAIRKHLSKWGYKRKVTRNVVDRLLVNKILSTRSIPAVESPPLANYLGGKKEEPTLLHQNKANLFTCPEGHIGKTVLTVGLDDCKWIYGEVKWGDVSRIVYCGNQSIPGQSYCDMHDKLCHPQEN
jgi:hypothetical protein